MITVAAPVAINIAPAQRSLLLESFIDSSMPNDRTRWARSALSCPRADFGFPRDRHFGRASRQRPTCGRTSGHSRRGSETRPMPAASLGDGSVSRGPSPAFRFDAALLHDPLPFAHFLHHEVAELA